MSDARLNVETALDTLQEIQAKSTRPLRLVVRKSNPGGMTGHQTTEIQGIYAGFDWESGRVIIEPARPLTELTAEQVGAIEKSVREGHSWHAQQREEKLRSRIAELDAEVARLRAAQASPL